MTYSLENEQIDYNDVVDKLQHYMLTNNKIEQSIKHATTTTSNNILKNKTQYKREFQNANHDGLYIPRETDTLFWCFYIMKNGYDDYNSIAHKNIVFEKKIKFGFIDNIRKQKDLIKTYNFTSLVNVENALANDNKIDIPTFLTMCIIEKMNVIYINKKTFFELRMNDSETTYLLHALDNKKYGCIIDETKQYMNLTDTLYRIDNIKKPVKTLANYKIPDLIDICNKLGLQTYNTETKKTKLKSDLYESIIQYL